MPDEPENRSGDEGARDLPTPDLQASSGGGDTSSESAESVSLEAAQAMVAEAIKPLQVEIESLKREDQSRHDKRMHGLQTELKTLQPLKELLPYLGGKENFTEQDLVDAQRQHWIDRQMAGGEQAGTVPSSDPGRSTERDTSPDKETVDSNTLRMLERVEAKRGIKIPDAAVRQIAEGKSFASEFDWWAAVDDLGEQIEKGTFSLTESGKAPGAPTSAGATDSADRINEIYLELAELNREPSKHRDKIEALRKEKSELEKGS